jgi:hypothetical protein
LAVVLSPVGHSFSFVSIPATLSAVIGILVITYLIAAEFMKTFAARTR